MGTAAIVIVLIVLVGWLVLNRAAGSAGQSQAKRSNRPASGKPSQSPSGSPFHWPSIGDFEFEVVGESNYQRAIASVAGDHGTKSADMQCIAHLIPEDDNPHDPKAVVVKIQGKVVGYLARQDARSFRRRLGQKVVSGQETTCDALIAGGGTRKSGEKLHYGVRLDIKPFES